MKKTAQILTIFYLAALALHCQTSSSLAKETRANQIKFICALVVQAESEKGLLAQMIDRKQSQQLPKSKIGLMLHAATDAQLGAPGWPEEILGTLPVSDLEMEAFLEFTHGNDNQRYEPLFQVYYAMAFKAASHHPDALSRIFQISREFGTQDWPDYDNIDWFCNQLKDVERENPKAFQTALQSEKPGMRKYIMSCTEPSPR